MAFEAMWETKLGLHAHKKVSHPSICPIWLSDAMINTMTERNLGLPGLYYKTMLYH